MSGPTDPVGILRRHRPLLLAFETIGWLHMIGKARETFLRENGGQKNRNGYKDTDWCRIEVAWDDLLEWVRDGRVWDIPCESWPTSLADFTTRQREDDTGLLGLFQAAHGMASGVEKNLPGRTSKYLNQDVNHMWLTTAMGQPVRNLLVDPPELLSDVGWRELLDRVKGLLRELERLGKDTALGEEEWWRWREDVIGPNGWLRRSLTSTLAETRVPDNDVTLWDQSYVAAALFKSAAAGAVLEGKAFPWNHARLKQQTRWRLLTVGIGADHYEARAVRVGDWMGARLQLDGFLDQIRKLIEVNLALGTVLYRDSEIVAFSFPGQRLEGAGGFSDAEADCLLEALQAKIDRSAEESELETPPYCRLSGSTRSLVLMTKEIKAARNRLAIPVHRTWNIPSSAEEAGHVCPVCRVRFNGRLSDKQQPCAVCLERRPGRLRAWLDGRLGNDSIWLSEVADHNGRVALLTLSFDLLPWLDGTRVDSLRTQAVPEWRTHNPRLDNQGNPIDCRAPYKSLTEYVENKIQEPRFDSQDCVLRALQLGFGREKDWESFFRKVIQDRSGSPRWDELDSHQRACWIVHQLLRKNASPGRVYRFWRTTEAFFQRLINRFREIASMDENRWRVRRLALKPDPQTNLGWRDGDVYDGRLGDAPMSLLYHEESGAFITICNLARLLDAAESASDLVRRMNECSDSGVEVKSDDDKVARPLKVLGGKDAVGRPSVYCPIISLELSPERFRVLVPLESVSACVAATIAAWNEEFARAWDRLPLRVGVVVFSQMLPFQAVVEATRNIEAEFAQASRREPETWRVAARETRDGVVALSCIRPDGGRELLTIPVRLPDGRRDVFYPYAAVTDTRVRFPLDFQAPASQVSRHQDESPAAGGIAQTAVDQVYRHAGDLRAGDAIRVHPARIATLFLDSTGRRFEPAPARPVSDWLQEEEVWSLLRRIGPTMTALRGAWRTLTDARERWIRPDGSWDEGGHEAWLDLVRAVIGERLEVQGAELDTLVDAARSGVLARALEWHLTVQKERLKEEAYVDE